MTRNTGGCGLNNSGNIGNGVTNTIPSLREDTTGVTDGAERGEL